MSEQVVLVNEQDAVVGVAEKLDAHRRGLLHRAFSVFLVNPRGQILLQQRAAEKYHSPNLWSNTCCSHPRPGETTVDAASRRLREEMGISADLRVVTSFTYRTDFDNGLIEHEYDHVLFGRFDGAPEPNPDEVSGWRWVAPAELREDIESNPERYSFWLRVAMERLGGAFDVKRAVG